MTEQGKHTPGPWRAGIGDDGMPKRGEFQQEVACIPHMYLDAIDIFVPLHDGASPHHCCHQEFEANARLIAAAPDLLVALKAMNEITPRLQLTNEEEAALALTDAALAKAEGVADPQSTKEASNG